MVTVAIGQDIIEFCDVANDSELCAWGPMDSCTLTKGATLAGLHCLNGRCL